MKTYNRKQTLLELQEKHMMHKALRVVRKFIRKPQTKPTLFKGEVARAFLETWAKTN
jgi:hypothetical protein